MSDLSLTILAETPGDEQAIERLHERTFGPGRYALSAYRLREHVDHLLDLSFTARIGTLMARLPDVRVTIDPTERHGFEYHSWIGFSLFGSVNGVPLRGEIGRGGAYAVRHPDGTREAAAGVSLYVDMLVDAGLGASARPRLFLPFGTTEAVGRQLRREGWATVQALSAEDSHAQCTHLWNGKQPVAKG